MKIADKIRTMTDEELAKFIGSIDDVFRFCELKCPYRKKGECTQPNRSCMDGRRAWLDLEV